MHIVISILLSSLLIISLACNKKQEEKKTEIPATPPSQTSQTTEAQQTPKTDEAQPAEKKEMPQDEFHSFKQGEASPKDPDYHKGTYVEEKVGLKDDLKESFAHPQTPDDVIAKYSDILLKDPNDASAWVMVGNGYSMKKMYDDAISKYQKAVAIKGLPEAYSNMGFAYFDKGDFKNAQANHEKALSIEPQFANAYYGLAMIYEKNGDTKNALSHWKGYVKVADQKSVLWIEAAKKRIKELEGDHG